MYHGTYFNIHSNSHRFIISRSHLLIVLTMATRTPGRYDDDSEPTEGGRGDGGGGREDSISFTSPSDVDTTRGSGSIGMQEDVLLGGGGQEQHDPNDQHHDQQVQQQGNRPTTAKDGGNNDYDMGGGEEFESTAPPVGSQSEEMHSQPLLGGGSGGASAAAAVTTEHHEKAGKGADDDGDEEADSSPLKLLADAAGRGTTTTEDRSGDMVPQRPSASPHGAAARSAAVAPPHFTNDNEDEHYKGDASDASDDSGEDNNGDEEDEDDDVDCDESSVDSHEERRNKILRFSHTEFSNMGASLKCPICLHTFKQPCVLPCKHAFCYTCISDSLEAERKLANDTRSKSNKNSPAITYCDKCPVCKIKVTKRAIVPSDHLADVAGAYKVILRSFGMAPIAYDPDVEMTQNIPSDGYTDDEEDNDEMMGNHGCYGGSFGGAKKRSIDDDDNVDYDGYGMSPRKKKKKKARNEPGLMEVHEHQIMAKAMHKAMQQDGRKDDQQQDDDAGRARRSTRSSSTAAPTAHQERARQLFKAIEERAHENKLNDLGRVIKANDIQLVKAAKNRLQRLNDGGTVETGSTNTDGAPVVAAAAASTPTETAVNGYKEEEEAIQGARTPEAKQQLPNDTEKNNPEPTSSATTPRAWFIDQSVPTVDQSVPDVAVPASENKKEISDITTDSTILRNDSTKKPPASEENILSDPAKEDEGVFEQHGGDDDEGFSSYDVMPAFEESTMTQDARDKEAADRSDELEDTPNSLDNLIEQQRAELGNDRMVDDNYDEEEEKEASPEQDFPDVDDEGVEAPIEQEEALEPIHETEDVVVEEAEPKAEAKDAKEQEDEQEEEALEPAYEPDDMVVEEEEEVQKVEAEGAEEQNEVGAGGAEASSEREMGTNEDNNEGATALSIEHNDEHVEPEAPEPLQEAPLQQTPERRAGTPSRGTSNAFSVGTIVNVEARLWPGVNKPGGVARIAKVHASESGTRYDITYVLGGKEKNVDATFVKLTEEEQEEFLSPVKKDGEDNTTSGATRRGGRSRRAGRASKRAPAQKENKTPSAAEYMPDISFSEAIKKAKSNSLQVEEGKALSITQGGDRERVSLVSTTKRKGRGKTTGIEDDANDAKPAAVGKSADSSALESIPERNDDESSAMLDATKLQLADERYSELLEGKRTINIISSSLSETDKGTMEEVRKELKKAGVALKHMKDFKPGVTDLCITSKSSTANAPENYVLAQFRTLKVMRSALAGIPIVSPDWLRVCLDAEELVMPSGNNCIRTLPPKAGTDHLLPINPSAHTGPTAWLGVAKYAALLQRQSEGGGEEFEHLPLSDTSVLLCGNFPKGAGPPKADLITLLRETGANVITSAAAAAKKVKDDDDSTLVLICDDAKSNKQNGITDALNKRITAAVTDETQQNRRILVVSFNWLFDSVSCGEMLDADNYQPNSPRAKALWTLSSDN